MDLIKALRGKPRGALPGYDDLFMDDLNRLEKYGLDGRSEVFNKKKISFDAGIGLKENSKSPRKPLQRLYRDERSDEVRTSAKSESARTLPALTPKAAIPGRQNHYHYQSISQFTQVTNLYKGSVSTVYKAISSVSGSTVILKVYHKDKMKPKNMKRMEREILLMKQHGGSGVIELYDNFEDAQNTYLVMEYCEGGDLFKHLLMSGGTLDEKWIITEVVGPLLTTLARLHGSNVLHRDIKPENIFLTASKQMVLGDLGLAICSSTEVPYARSGTLDYMSPEASTRVIANPATDLQEGPDITAIDLEKRGIKPYTDKVDVWAVGVLAYELLVGRPPFEVENEARTANMILYSNDIQYPKKHSAQWADFVRQALDKGPAKRPSAAQLLKHEWLRPYCERSTKLKQDVWNPAPTPQRGFLTMPRHTEKPSQGRSLLNNVTEVSRTGSETSEHGFSKQNDGNTAEREDPLAHGSDQINRVLSHQKHHKHLDAVPS
eukprot:jgi/Botrbrau1/18201/Bobra.53_1s0060.1